MIELGNVERTTGDAVLAADAVCLLKIDDTVLVLDNCAISRTGLQTSRFRAVHALVFAHQQHRAAVPTAFCALRYRRAFSTASAAPREIRSAT